MAPGSFALVALLAVSLGAFADRDRSRRSGVPHGARLALSGKDEVSLLASGKMVHKLDEAKATRRQAARRQAAETARLEAELGGQVAQDDIDELFEQGSQKIEALDQRIRGAHELSEKTEQAAKSWKQRALPGIEEKTEGLSQEVYALRQELDASARQVRDSATQDTGDKSRPRLGPAEERSADAEQAREDPQDNDSNHKPPAKAIEDLEHDDSNREPPVETEAEEDGPDEDMSKAEEDAPDEDTSKAKHRASMADDIAPAGDMADAAPAAAEAAHRASMANVFADVDKLGTTAKQAGQSAPDARTRKAFIAETNKKREKDKHVRGTIAKLKSLLKGRRGALGTQ
mmetsp:Transcript_81843/g.236568  ORF Transcript_81843/g.236568 Transcript_81843/m.236568 type:complete len:345 (-) Transcript_81843:32-1066(-)